MCHTTKDNIVLTLRELMKDRPLRKIKVQDVMIATGMTRQSFYYHFQDIYQVVEWELERKFLRKIAYDPDTDLFQWYRHVVQELDQDADFYRRVSRNMDVAVLHRLMDPLIRPNVSKFLFDDPQASNLTSVESYCCTIVCEMLFNAFHIHVDRRVALPPEELEGRMACMDLMLTGIRKELQSANKN